MGKIDLHIHTTCSDWILTPFEVIDEAVKNQVEIIAISDHDTLSAYTDWLFDYAEQKNIHLVPAVEISTKEKKVWFHVLGYNVDLKDLYFQESLFKLRNARHQYLFDVAKKLNDCGYFLNVDRLDTIDAVTKAHISQDIIDNPQNTNLLLKEFWYLPNKWEFIETMMNEHCPCYVEKHTISPKEAVDLIKSAGGFPVLAHPVASTYEDNISEDEILTLVKTMWVTAIEGNYVYVDKKGEKHNDSKKWNAFAEQYWLLSTIWSDFHFFDGIRPVIWLLNEDIPVLDRERIMNAIYKR